MLSSVLRDGEDWEKEMNQRKRDREKKMYLEYATFPLAEPTKCLDVDRTLHGVFGSRWMANGQGGG